MPGETLQSALEREHREIDRGIEAYIARPGDGAPATPLVEAMQALRRHIYLEECFPFPPAEASTELARLLAAGHTPEGWICQQARR